MKKLLLFLFLIIFLAFPQRAKANENFSTYYNVIYKVLPSGTTNVSFSIELRNNTSERYVSSYIIETGYKDAKNIKVVDSKGNASFTSEPTEDGNKIDMKFNQNVVGINNTQKFTLSFDTDEIAKKYGNVWEVNIPGVANQESYSAFNVDVVTPDEFGTPTFIKPNVPNRKINSNTIEFTKDELGKSGISISYGQKQIYNFNLKYHLKNNNAIPITHEIAIPSNNNYQDVYIKSMIPQPSNVFIDKDGNWIAKYKLKAFQRLDVEVNGFAEVYYKPRAEGITKEQRIAYTKPLDYWEANDPEIKKLANELKTPEAIYDYVVKNLKYDQSRINEEQQIRIGAKELLGKKDSAVCLEFTDLFVALSRAAGIPARAVEGYGNTSNDSQRPLSLVKDVLHAWPEYYDDKTGRWIMVDPTWENTTHGIDYFNVFDFDHFAFVIKGYDSELPISAGGYKLPDTKDIQDVFVETSSEVESKTEQIRVSSKFSDKLIAGLPMNGKIVIKNAGSTLIPAQTFFVTSDNLFPTKQSLHFDRIPPYGTVEVPVKFNPVAPLTKGEVSFKISVLGSEVNKTVYVAPFYENIIFIFIVIGLLLISVITITISFVARRSRRVPVS